jgi:hypothetical protein
LYEAVCLDWREVLAASSLLHRLFLLLIAILHLSNIAIFVTSGTVWILAKDAAKLVVFMADAGPHGLGEGYTYPEGVYYLLISVSHFLFMCVFFFPPYLASNCQLRFRQLILNYYSAFFLLCACARIQTVKTPLQSPRKWKVSVFFCSKTNNINRR